MLQLIFKSFISGLLFYFSWPTNFTILTPLIFFAFIPLLLIQKEVETKKNGNIIFFICCYISFLIFNFTTTFWVEKASPAFGEGLFAVLCNSLFMSIVLYFFHICKKNIKLISPLFFLSFFWVLFEILHFNWELNWPWLTLGNAFSELPSWIQWFSYTGVLGGSLWVILINYCIYNIYVFYLDFGHVQIKKLIYILFLIIIPISCSLILSLSFKYSGKKINVLVAQTNLDPNTKFENQSWKFEKKLFYDLTNNVTDSIDYVIFPETYLSTQFTLINDKPIQYNRNQIAHIIRMVEKYKNLNIILGATIDHFLDGQKIKKYNSVLQINSDSLSYYHKSKLVPGAEQLPFRNYLKYFFKDNFLSLAGGAGNLSVQDSISLIEFNDNKIASLVCYESVFPNHVREFIDKGAQAIFIITNDGWWGDSQGRKQHNSYARIRAIENRRYVVRSANTGISSVINPLGYFEKIIDPNKTDTFITPISLLSSKTFYVKYGNILIFIYLAVVLVLSIIINRKNKDYGII